MRAAPTHAVLRPRFPGPWAQHASPRRASPRGVRRPPSPAPPPPPPPQPPGEEPAGDTDGTHPWQTIARIRRGLADGLQRPIEMRILTLPHPASGPRPIRASASAEEASRNFPSVPRGSGTRGGAAARAGGRGSRLWAGFPWGRGRGRGRAGPTPSRRGRSRV